MFGKDVFAAFFSTKGNVRRSDPQLMRRMNVTVNYNGSVLLSSAKMSVVASKVYIFRRASLHLHFYFLLQTKIFLESSAQCNGKKKMIVKLA